MAKKEVQNWILEKVLGSGQSGVVYLARNKNQQDDLKVAAIKKIPTKCGNQKQLQRIKNEKERLDPMTKHPNIVKYYKIIVKKKSLYVVMELCNGGDLRSYCEKQNNKLQEPEAQLFAVQILSGLLYLRELRGLHRDIKPENILIQQQNNINILKITDFGLSRRLAENELATSMCGTPLYTAPEILEQESYDFKVDLWSFGIIAYEMLEGILPFNATSITSLKRMFKNTLPWNILQISEEAKDLLQNVLVANKQNRKDIREIYRHVWIQKGLENIKSLSKEYAQTL